MGTLLIKESGDLSPNQFLGQTLSLAIQMGNVPPASLGLFQNSIPTGEIHN